MVLDWLWLFFDNLQTVYPTRVVHKFMSVATTQLVNHAYLNVCMRIVNVGFEEDRTNLPHFVVQFGNNYLSRWQAKQTSNCSRAGLLLWLYNGVFHSQQIDHPPTFTKQEIRYFRILFPLWLPEFAFALLAWSGDWKIKNLITWAIGCNSTQTSRTTTNGTSLGGNANTTHIHVVHSTHEPIYMHTQ